ncbi:MAG: GTPase Era, partial [Deltaproteobacteria bacterium]|nr:GTPase Era [Deltaproteobacteria bacterium]
VEDLSRAYPFKRAYPVSATGGEGIDVLTRDVLDLLPEGPFLYPPEEISNVPQSFYAAEIIREKAMEATEEEIPHSIGVDIEELSKKEDGSFTIRAVLYVDRDSRKGILIGAGGRKIKEIGSRAREELQCILEAPVHLMTRVEVKRDWRDHPRATGI